MWKIAKTNPEKNDVAQEKILNQEQEQEREQGQEQGQVQGQEQGQPVLYNRGTPYSLFTGSFLKWIAIISMIIDHIGASFLERGLEDYTLFQESVSQKLPWIWNHVAFLQSPERLKVVDYYVFRGIGRLAFPIYVFLLVEGFARTSSRRKYLIRLLGFAALSEPFFDRAFFDGWIYPFYQNVYFTLALGCLGLSFWEWDRMKEHFWLKVTGELALGAVAYYLGFDYGAFGVWIIVILYVVREHNKGRYLLMESIIGAVAFAYEISAPIAFLFIAGYNEKRGSGWKMFFYFVYPVHLALLALLQVYLYG